MPENKISFDVHPSVIFQLGADLISDDIQALIELIKNSYDANATYAHVQVDTTDSPSVALPESFYADARGFIRITDDGEGMNLDSIRNGWFVVSNSAKRQLKKAGTTNGKRVMDPKNWTQKWPFLKWSAALKMKESQCHERVRVTHPA